MSAASLIANHMNVPYGKIVGEEDVVASFRHGELSASSREANAILAPVKRQEGMGPVIPS